MNGHVQSIAKLSTVTNCKLQESPVAVTRTRVEPDNGSHRREPDNNMGGVPVSNPPKMNSFLLKKNKMRKTTNKVNGKINQSGIFHDILQRCKGFLLALDLQ